MVPGPLEATVGEVGGVGLQEVSGLCFGTLQVQLGGAGGTGRWGGRWLIQ